MKRMSEWVSFFRFRFILSLTERTEHTERTERTCSFEVVFFFNIVFYTVIRYIYACHVN